MASAASLRLVLQRLIHRLGVFRILRNDVRDAFRIKEVFNNIRTDATTAVLCLNSVRLVETDASFSRFRGFLRNRCGCLRLSRLRCLTLGCLCGSCLSFSSLCRSGLCWGCLCGSCCLSSTGCRFFCNLIPKLQLRQDGVDFILPHGERNIERPHATNAATTNLTTRDLIQHGDPLGIVLTKLTRRQALKQDACNIAGDVEVGCFSHLQRLAEHLRILFFAQACVCEIKCTSFC